MEFEVSDNPHDVVKLDVKGAPVIITLSQVWAHTSWLILLASLFFFFVLFFFFLPDR